MCAVPFEVDSPPLARTSTTDEIAIPDALKLTSPCDEDSYPGEISTSAAARVPVSRLYTNSVKKVWL